jgi:hypothetical protein
MERRGNGGARGETGPAEAADFDEGHHGGGSTSTVRDLGGEPQEPRSGRHEPPALDDDEFIARFLPEIHDFLAPLTLFERSQQATKASLRSQAINEKTRAFCRQIEELWSNVCFQIKDEAGFAGRHNVFIRVLMTPSGRGFYLVPRGGQCAVCFFRGEVAGKNWRQRVRGLFSSKSSYYSAYLRQHTRTRAHVGSVTYQPADITDADILGWLKYVCADFEPRYAPAE